MSKEMAETCWSGLGEWMRGGLDEAKETMAQTNQATLDVR